MSSQLAVIATNPTKIPLQKAQISNLLTFECSPVIRFLTNTDVIPPIEGARKQFMIILGALFLRGKNIEEILPPLKNNQANHKIKVPSITLVGELGLNSSV